jgi:hypothetical protein
MSTKEITINKSFLKVGGSSSGKGNNSSSKPRKRDSGTSRNNKRNYSGLRKDILSRLKEMQSEDGIKHIQEDSNMSQLEDSIQYINKLIERKKKRRQNKTLKRSLKKEKSRISLDEPKQEVITQPKSVVTPEVPVVSKKVAIEPTYTEPTVPIVNEELSHKLETITSTSIKDAPAYGILKGGTKPTYRQYFNKTLKHNKQAETSSVSPEKPLTTYQKYIRSREIPKNISKNLRRRFKEFKVKTFKKKYKLGKNNETRKIGVLIKDSKTQKNIRDHLIELEKKPIIEKKEELRKRNILKLGSSAPDKLINTLYRNMILSGDIVNTSSDVLVHNFMNENKF